MTTWRPRTCLLRKGCTTPGPWLPGPSQFGKRSSWWTPRPVHTTQMRMLCKSTCLRRLERSPGHSRGTPEPHSGCTSHQCKNCSLQIGCWRQSSHQGSPNSWSTTWRSRTCPERRGHTAPDRWLPGQIPRGTRCSLLPPRPGRSSPTNKPCTLLSPQAVQNYPRCSFCRSLDPRR
jgi:hypothetical protein